MHALRGRGRARAAANRLIVMPSGRINPISHALLIGAPEFADAATRALAASYYSGVGCRNRGIGVARFTSPGWLLRPTINKAKGLPKLICETRSTACSVTFCFGRAQLRFTRPALAPPPTPA